MIKLTFFGITEEQINDVFVKKYAYADYLHVAAAERPIDGTVFFRGTNIIREGSSEEGITSDTGSPGSQHLHFELHLPHDPNALQYVERPTSNYKNMLPEKFGSVNPSRFFAEF